MRISHIHVHNEIFSNPLPPSLVGLNAYAILPVNGYQNLFMYTQL